MELIEPCAEGYYDHDQDPNSACVPLWAAPSVEFTIDDEAWLGESYTLNIRVDSEDREFLNVEWIQESGTIQNHIVNLETPFNANITELLGEHQEVIQFAVQVTDSIGQTTRTNLSFTLLDRITSAVEQGNPQLLPSSELDLLSRIIQEVDRLQTLLSESLAYLFNEQAISYDPSRHSQFFTPLSLSETSPLVLGNGGKLLAAKYERSDFRAAAFGTNVFAKIQGGQLAGFGPVLERVILWLTWQDGDQAVPISPKMIKLIGLNQGAARQVLNYLQSSFPLWSLTQCELDEFLGSCLSGADLIVVGTQNIEDHDDFIAQLSELISGSINPDRLNRPAVLYTHQHSWNSNEASVSLLPLLGLSIQSQGGPGNYFAQDLAQWDDAEDMIAQSSSFASIKNMAEHFQDQDFNFDLSLCEGDCRQNQDFVNGFSDAARLLRLQNQTLAKQGHYLFDQEGEDLHKLLVLLGDFWRRTVQFPQSKDRTDQIQFLKSYYADHSHLISRHINPLQSDLGDFSRSDFSHVQSINTTKQYMSKAPFRSAQVYALPGQSFTAEYLVPDSDQITVQAPEVWLQINSVRNSSVHEFDVDGYTRPKFIGSHAVQLKVGEPMTFTSAYGGPIQLRFEQADLPVSIRFTNVAQHPVWKDSSDDLSFIAALDTGDFDWVEFITPHFEIHSTLSKMRETFASPLFDTGTELEALIRTYHHGYALAMAGYQGPGIMEIPEITDFIDQKLWPLPERNVVQHFNADKPTCGYGCSGNPYDAAWAFAPLGHGDLHEVGHNHERGRFKFNDREGHATTNFYSYFPKQQHALDTGTMPDCQQLPFQGLFDKLQDAQLMLNPFDSMNSDQSLNGWSQGVTMVIQALMAAERMGQISRGWYLIGRLHAHERAFRQALNDDEVWLAMRASIGFEALSRQEANNLSNNNYLFVALSTVSELNYEDYFMMWGLTIMDRLKQSIRAHGYPLVPQVYYAVEADGACGLWNAREVPIDGQSLWLDLDQFERQSLDLNQSYLSSPYQSQDSSVYFLTTDADIGPNQRVWWGSNDEVTELRLPIENQAQTHQSYLIIDAYQRRCDTLMTFNAGRVGGCEHRLFLEIDSIKNSGLNSGERYFSLEHLPLILEAWRWHAPVEKLDTLVLDLSYTAP